MDETPGIRGWFAADMSIATGPAVVGYAKSRAVVRQSTRKEKPVRSRKLQLGLAAAAVIALAVTLGVRRGVIDVLLMVGIAAAVAGMYLLRRYARAGLVYNRHVESPAPIRLPRTEEGSRSCQQSTSQLATRGFHRR
jgi:hypothetical protein